MNSDGTAGGVLALALVVAALAIFILRRSGHEPRFIRRIEDRLQAHSKIGAARPTSWRKAAVGTKVELSLLKTSPKLRFLGELALLFAMSFFIAEILTNTRFVRDGGFIWLLIGLPACFVLGRFWRRKYH